jgi:hypothetical protein
MSGSAATNARHTVTAGDHRSPDHRKCDTVLATVKDAARRLPRWPKRAILDRGCARRQWAKAGRDGKTALGVEQKN